MMTDNQRRDVKKVARILLIIHAASVVLQMVGYFQTQYQLVSPLIPASLIKTLAEPYLKVSVISTGTFIAALVLYICKKHILTIIICSLTIVVQQVISPVFFG